jgi:hypothetical protein
MIGLLDEARYICWKFMHFYHCIHKSVAFDGDKNFLKHMIKIYPIILQLPPLPPPPL